MKNKLKYMIAASFAFAILFVACQDDDHNLGDLKTPTNFVINTNIVGQSATFPNGDGSGNVNITLSSNGAVSYKIGYNLVSEPTTSSFEIYPSGVLLKKFEEPGEKTYRITAVAYGAGGVTSTTTKDITVRFDFNMDPTIIQNLTNGTSKAWVVDKSVAGHLRIGPWSDPSSHWWSAGIDEKVACCNCFYTATYTFVKTPSNTYQLAVASPDGIFMNTNSAENNLGVSANSGEMCYPLSQPTKGINFGDAASSFPSTYFSDVTSTTGYKISVAGNDGFIGYGSASNTYEILESTPTYLYLRSRGVNQGNFWYIKLKPAL
ncbi:hypothetical protein [Flavobacterium sp.]|jgi:hypothetical protein|uniref:hypothetical protein n=1 Tax=Flavobacterium sp. TaxID=239 RepID=UPI0037C1204B